MLLKLPERGWGVYIMDEYFSIIRMQDLILLGSP